MSTTIDQKVVEMKFDNKQFESGVKESISSLEKLKQSLKLEEAAKGLDGLNTSASKINMGGLGEAVENVTQKFSALEIMGVTALVNITNKAVNAGTSLIKSLSVDNITAGWTKFNEMTNNTATLISQGFKMSEVEEQLERLNWFTDETSYNLTDMVNSISAFTTTGQGLTESVTAMEGIALWAASAGQNASTASRAMVQLSQAMSRTMNKQDWNSIQTANMDTQEFRQHALDAAVALGTLRKNSDGTYQSLVATQKTSAFTIEQFADSLSKGAWFTKDVMMTVYQEYASVTDKIKEYAEENGVTASEAIEALSGELDQFSLNAFKAGQEARTWGDVISSVQDAVSTGWMNTFKAIIGNSQEATALFTDLANILWEVFNGGAEARNEMMQAWKEDGGRRALLDSLSHILSVIVQIKEVIGDAFHEIFPAMTAERLVEITQNFEKFTKSLIMSESTMQNLKDTFAGVFSIIDLFKTVVMEVIKAIIPGVKTGKDVIKVVIAITGYLGRLTTAMVENIKQSGVIQTTIKGIGEAITFIATVIALLIIKIVDITSKIIGFVTNTKNLNIQLDNLKKNFPAIYSSLQNIKNAITVVINAVKTFITMGIPAFIGTVILGIKNLVTNIKELSTNVLKFINDVINAKGISAKLDVIRNAFKSLKEDVLNFIGNEKLIEFSNRVDTNLERIKEGLSLLLGKIKEFASHISPANIGLFMLGASLVAVAVSIANVNTRFADCATSITGFFSTLTKGLRRTSKTSKWIMELGEAVVLLAGSVYLLSKIPKEDLWRSVGALGALAGILAVLGGLSAVFSKISPAMKRFGTTAIGFAAAMAILTVALYAMNNLSMNNIWEKVLVLGAIMLEFGVIVQVMRGFSGGSIRSSLMLLSFALAMNSLIKAIAELCAVDTSKLVENLDDILVLMAMFTGLAVIAGNVGVGSAIGLLAVAIVLKQAAPILNELADYNYEGILKQLEKYRDTIIYISVIAGAMAIASSIAGKGMLSFGLGVGALALGIYSLTLVAKEVVKFLETADIKTFNLALGAISQFGNLILAMEALAFFTKDSKLKGFGATLVGVAVALSIMLTVATTAAMIDPDAFKTATLCMGGLMAVVGALEYMSKYTKEAKVMAIIPLMTAVTAIMGIMLAMVSFIATSADDKMLYTFALVSGAFMGIMGFLAKILDSSSKIKKADPDPNAWKNITATIGAISAVMAGMAVMAVFGKDVGSILAAAGGTAAVMLTLTFLFKTLTKLTSKSDGLDTSALTKIAAVCAGIAGIMAAMAFMSMQDPLSILTAWAATALMLIELSVVFGIISKFKNVDKIPSIAKSLAIASLSLVGIASALVLLSNFTGDDIGPALISMGASFLALATALGILSKIKSADNMPAIAASLLLASLSLVTIAGALTILSGESWDTIGTGLASMLICFTVLSGVLLFMTSKFDKNVMDAIGIAGALVAVSFTLVPIAAALKILAGEDWSTIGAGLGAMLITFGILALVVGAMAKIFETGVMTVLSMSAALLLASLSILPIAVALKMLCGMNWDDLGHGLLAVLGCFGILTLVLLAVSALGMATGGLGTAIIAATAISLLAMGAAILFLGLAAKSAAEGLLTLSQVPLGEFAQNLLLFFTTLQEHAQTISDVGTALVPFGFALLEIGNAFLIVSAAALIMSVALDIAALGIAVIALSFNLLITPLQIFQTLDWDTISNGISNLAWSVAGLGGAGIVLTIGAIGILAGAIAVGLLDLAVAAADPEKIAALGESFDVLASNSGKMASAGLQMVVGAAGVYLMGASLKATGETAEVSAKQMENAAISAGKSSELFVAAGEYSGKGLINGMLSTLDSIGKAGAVMGMASAIGLCDALIINSPSEFFYGLGEYTGLGFFNGIGDMCAAVEQAGAGLGLSGAAGAEATAPIYEKIGELCGGEFAAGLQDKLNGVMESITSTLTDSGVGDYIKENFLGGKDLGDFKEFFNFEDLTSGLEDMTSGMSNLTDATGKAGGAATKTKSAFEELTDTISGQMDIFSEWSNQEAISADKMLENMRSQIQGVSNWAYNLSALAQKGISQGLLNELSKLGPQGSAKVQAFMDMTQDQLLEANTWYEASLLMPQGAATAITNSFAQAGQNASLGYANGIDVNAANNNMIQLANNSLNAIRNVLQIHSPSRVMYEIGTYLVQGLGNGISGSNVATNKAIILGKNVVNAFKTYINFNEGKKIGGYICDGIASGITSNTSKVVKAAESLANSIPSTVRKLLKIESPSKVMEEAGMYSDLGMAQGLTKYASVVEKASEGVAQDSINAYNSSIEDITAMNLNPVIAPTLDLTNVEAGASQLNSMFGNKTISATVEAINQNGSTNTAVMSDLKEEIINLGNKIAAMQIRLDSGTLVGELTPGINLELGAISNRQRRGL